MKITTAYTVLIGGIMQYTSLDLSEAIREWDRLGTEQTITHGGISVVARNANGVMIRDGWILKVSPDHTYMNPRLADIATA